MVAVVARLLLGDLGLEERRDDQTLSWRERAAHRLEQVVRSRRAAAPRSASVATLTSAALSRWQSSIVRTLWPTSRPMSHRNVRKRSMPASAVRDVALRQQDQHVDVGAGVQFAAAVAADRDQVDVRSRAARRAAPTRVRSTTSTMRARSRTSASTGSSSAKRCFEVWRRRRRAPARNAARAVRRPSSAAGSVSRNGHGGSAMRPEAASSRRLARMAAHAQAGGRSLAPSVSTS